MTKRVRKKKKNRIKIGRVIIALIILIGIAFGLIKILKYTKDNIKIINKDYYLSFKKIKYIYK